MSQWSRNAFVINPERKAIEIFTDAVRYCVIYEHSNPDDLKEAARRHSLNKVASIINSLYETAYLDDFVCHKSIIFYGKVRGLILKM